MKGVTTQLLDTYTHQYNEGASEWRRLGGAQKSDNIIHLCKHLQVKNMLDVGSGDGAVLDFLDKKAFCPSMSSIEISESGVMLGAYQQ